MSDILIIQKFQFFSYCAILIMHKFNFSEWQQLDNWAFVFLSSSAVVWCGCGQPQIR